MNEMNKSVKNYSKNTKKTKTKEYCRGVVMNRKRGKLFPLISPAFLVSFIFISMDWELKEDDSGVENCHKDILLKHSLYLW